MDLQGSVITRWHIDDTVYGLGNQDVRVFCDPWGFRKIKDMYEGWLGIPYINDMGLPATDGVHPVSMTRFSVVCCKKHNDGALEFRDESNKTIAEIFNYSTSC